MNVEFSVGGQIVTNDETHLLHVNATSPQIRSNQHAGRSTAKFFHHGFSLRLCHVSMHGTHGKVMFLHFLGQPIHLGLGIAKNDRLCNRQSIIQITESIKLPFLLFDRHIELTNALQSQFIPFDENLNCIIHEFLRHVQYFDRKGGTDKDDLGGRWQKAINVINLFLETTIQHFVCLIQNQSLELLCLEGIAANQIKHPSRSAAQNLGFAVSASAFEGFVVIAHGFSSDTAMNMNATRILS
mmetsp:Transcript_29321/g.53666  ORF Transcript_29321/g.53666 Transcript_29321/m.53666 type:complete len:241 (+) Transcript_29321:304-1026(+)